MDLIFSTPVNGNQTTHRWTGVEAGWHVRGKAQCAGSAETVDKSLPPVQHTHKTHSKKKKNAVSPTTHEGEGRKRPQSGWCMVWTLVWDLGFNREKGRKWKGGGGSCLNYADVGCNRGGKPTKGMASTGTCSHKWGYYHSGLTNADSWGTVEVRSFKGPDG